MFSSDLDVVLEDSGERSFLCAESPHTPLMLATDVPQAVVHHVEEPPSSTSSTHGHGSDASPAVQEDGALDDRSYCSVAKPPSELTQLTQGNLQQIANSLPHHKWKSLGRVLGLPHRDLENIVANHPHDPVEQRYQMLQLWCSQNEDALWNKLTGALCSEEVGCPQLARKFQVSGSKSGVCEGAHFLLLLHAHVGYVHWHRSCLRRGRTLAVSRILQHFHGNV